MNTEEQLQCFACQAAGNHSIFRKEENRFVCDKCGTKVILETSDPVPGWMLDFRRKADENFTLMRDPLTERQLQTPRLQFLYREAYFNVLFGLYNAGIVMLGVLLEAFVKELIRLKENKNFKGEFKNANDYAYKRSYLKFKDYRFLEKFRENIRNLYQHNDIEAITKNSFIKSWPIEIEKNENVAVELNKALEKIRKGEIPPEVIRASDPRVADIAKTGIDKKIAIPQFNEVHDFLLVALHRYFTKEAWEAYHKNFPSKS